jgi:hypothetical protein
VIPAWSGRRVQQARAFMSRYLPAECAADEHAAACPGVIDGSDPAAWVVGHTLSRIEHPELTWRPNNWRIEARVCSDKSGPGTALAKARADGRRDALAEIAAAEREPAVVVADALFPTTPNLAEGKPSPLSLPGTPRPKVTSASKIAHGATPREPLEIRSDLAWSADRVRGYPWLADFADVPDDASPPLAMTYPPDDAVCSYGWEGCEHLDDGEQIVPWSEREHGSPLRWWQRLAIVRQHEHRADGSLVWGEVVESASRRSGKSHRMRAVATWRLAHAKVIGEVQSVVHCGNDLAVCRDVQKKAWRWAVGRWGVKAVKEGNGKEIIENPLDGSSWVVKAQGAAYGLDAGLAMADECWDVKPDTISEGLEPMNLERLWAQLHLTSTAHRRARSTMKTRIAQALAGGDGRTLLLWWAALPQDDPGDPETHRRASPHWTADRERLLASKYEKALAGEVDPEADDPDPMEGFRAQYLNVWPPLNVKPTRGEPIVDRLAWSELVLAQPSTTPAGAAIESHFDGGISVALAWRLADGAALVSVQTFDDLALAGFAVADSGFREPVDVSAGLVDDPALAGLTTRKATRAGGLAAVLDIARWLADGQIVHDGGEDLTRQVLAVRTVDGADGPRLASTGRLDAVKAAAWAATAARSKPVRRVGRVLTATV